MSLISEKKSEKIWFLQLARLIACLLVVYTHWFGLMSTPNVIHSLILQDPLVNYPAVSLTDYVGVIVGFLHLNHFTSVYFGLGLFFILSGYVIPLSLKNSTPSTYLIRRIFRIYPTLIICLIVSASTMMIASYFNVSSELTNLFEPKIIFSNLLLIRDFLGVRFIDNATWTLDIEIHFYILFFLFFYFAIEKKIMTFVISASLMLLIGYLLVSYSDSYSSSILLNQACRLFSRNGSYITFMFTGTTLYYLFSKQWRYVSGLTTLVFLLTVNYYCLNLNPENKGFGDFIFINHLYVLVFFAGLYFANNYIPYNKLLNKIADISYPLYLTHGFTGYTIYFVLYSLTNNIPLSAIAAFSIVLILVFLIHYTIEKPGIALSKTIIENKRMRRSFVSVST